MGLTLKLLGGFAVLDESDATLTLPTRKTCALFAYLAANADSPQQRERLTGLLWSDREERQARQSLSQALFAIRKLGRDHGVSLIDGNSERVILYGNAIETDLARFRARLRDNPRQAIAHYDGPFLDGLTIPDAAFDQWLSSTRLTLHEDACDALARASDTTAESGDLRTAISLARRLVALDPMGEDGHRRLMQLHFRNGDRTAAIRQYQVCAETLKSELRVEPDDATRALLQTIQTGPPPEHNAPGPAGLMRVQSPPLAIPEKPSIAVLPFQTISGDADQSYLADGVVEAITATLSRIRSFFVISRNSAFTLKDRTVNVVDIGRELGVAYVLEGSVQTSGNRVRITVQLVETEAGGHIWADHYDGTINEIFDLQDRITERVAGELQPSIRQAEIERCRRKRPQDQNAYDYTMRAMARVWTLERDECERALDLLAKALDIDPGYPSALSLAGWCHAQRAVYNWTDDIASSQHQAHALAERAAELSGDDPLILTVLGTVHTIIRNHGTARVLLERAVALDPNAAWAWQRLGWLETYAERPQLALDYFQRALRLSPLDPMNFNVHAGMGTAKEVAQQYDEAVSCYRRALEERPHADWIYRQLASALVDAGRPEEARQAYAKLIASYSDLTAKKVRKAMVFSDRMLDRIAKNLTALGLPD